MNDEQMSIVLLAFIVHHSSFVFAKEPGHGSPRTRHHPLLVLLSSGVAGVAGLFQDPVGFLDTHP
jgi:hypothetical protein